MAIGPNVLKKLSKKELEAVSRFEKKIDKQLLTETGNSLDGVTLGVGCNPSSRVITELIRRYNMAGWRKVSYEYDREEIGFFRFYR